MTLCPSYASGHGAPCFNWACSGIADFWRAEEAAGRVDAQHRGLAHGARAKVLTPQAKREAVAAMRSKHPISERSACRLVGIARTVLHYEGAAQPLNDRLKGRLVELAGERRRFGYRRLHVLMRREGWRVNHKRTWRLYREAELHVRRRRKRGPAAIERQPLVRPAAADTTWSMDFIFDRVGEANALKVLNIVDDFTKEAVVIVAGNSIRSIDVVRVLEQAVHFRRLPQSIRTDQGPEFTGRALLGWADERGVQLKLIQASKPTQNAYVESFNDTRFAESSTRPITEALSWRILQPWNRSQQLFTKLQTRSLVLSPGGPRNGSS